jgi:hypothetical protein
VETKAKIVESVKNKKRALVIGTRHEFQRHQDTMPDQEELRDEFEERLRQIIEEREITLIAEEAGDDTALWEYLKQEDEAVGEFAALFGKGSTTVDASAPTIAKEIADERPGELRHVDVRPPNANSLTIEQRDAAMATRTVEVSGRPTALS